jgi:ubiquitin-like 1-activating enzyme E1 B
VYPICTIRSTPTLPVHTIVWAKELYKLLFCPKVEESMLYEAVDGEGSEVETHRDTPGKEVVEREKGNEEGVGDGLGYEPSVYMQSVLDYRGALAMAMGKPTAISKDDDVEEEDIEVGNRKSETNGSSNGKSVEALARQVLTCLYKDEIQKQLDMGRYKAARKTPSPLKVEELLVLETNDVNMNGVAKNYINGSIPSTTRHDQVWTQHQCAHEFIRCLVEAVTVHAKSGGSGVQVLPEFDKDDPLGMRFVTAASNLRSYAFGIEPIQSYYSAKVRK